MDNSFFNLFNDIDEKYINEARHLSSPDSRMEKIYKRWSLPVAAVGAAACIALIFGVAKIRADLRSKDPDTGISVDAVVPELPFTDDTGNSFLLRGTPLSVDKLADFLYGGAVEKCREMLADDAELQAVLAEAPDGVEEMYYRARTLAEIASGSSGFINAAFTNSALANPTAAVIKVTEDTSAWYSSVHYKKDTVYRETGYSFDSFYNALCAVFDEHTAGQLLNSNSYFYNYDGQLFCSLTTATPVYEPLHTEYVIENNSDSAFVFKTVNYYPNYEMSRGGGETEYDPDKKAQYVTSEIPNSFINMIGRWRVQELCMQVSSSVWKGEAAPEYSLNVGGNEVRFCGVPLPESGIENVDLDALYAEYRETLGKDDGLKALFDGLGSEKSGLIDLYCDARALADFVGRYEPIKRYFTSSTLNGKPAAYFYDSTSSYVGDIYSETGLRYGDVLGGLQQAFTNDGLEMLLKTFPKIKEVDGVMYAMDNVRPKDEVSYTEYVLAENSDTEIAFYVRNFYDNLGGENGPYITQRVLNRIKKTDSGWRVSEISVFGTLSSTGDGEIYEDLSDPAFKVDKINGETVLIYGEPTQYSELKTELDYSEQYNALLNKDKSAYVFSDEGGLVDFLNGLDGEAAEIYLKAAALTDGFAECGYLPDLSLGVRISAEDNYYQTGYTLEAFENAMRGVFTVEAAQTIPSNLNMFSAYNGQLWQKYVYWTGTVAITNEYELVSASDTEIVFKTRVSRSQNGGESLQTINNRIVKTESGWRVAEMCLWGHRSSTEPEICSDFTLDETREILNVVKEYGDLCLGLTRDIDVDAQKPFTEETANRYFKVLDGTATKAELDGKLGGLLTDEGREQFDKELFRKYYRADNDGALYFKEGTNLDFEPFDGRLYLQRASKLGDDNVMIYALYNYENYLIGGELMHSIKIEMRKTSDGWRIDEFDYANANVIAGSTEIICGAETVTFK